MLLIANVKVIQGLKKQLIDKLNPKRLKCVGSMLRSDSMSLSEMRSKRLLKCARISSVHGVFTAKNNKNDMFFVLIANKICSK